MKNFTLTNLLKKESLIFFLKVFTVPALLVIVLFAISYLGEFNFAWLSRDPIQLLNGKPYYGVLSSIGVIIWSATAAVLFYTYFILKRGVKKERITTLLLLSGLLTTWMLIDDFFMMHDVVFPEYLGINEKFLYLFYGLSVVLIFWFFYRLIIDSDYIFLLFSFGFLACSVLTDVVIELGVYIPYSFAVEDGFKFMGIISWSVYFIRLSDKALKESVRKS